MRKGALLLLLVCVLCLLIWQVRAINLSKKFRANADNVSIAQLYGLVERMAGTAIVAPMLEEGKSYSFNWKDAPLSKVLNEISYSTGMVWEVKRGRIILKRREDIPTPELIQKREAQLKALVRFLLSLTERQNYIISIDALLPWDEISPTQKKLLKDCLGKEQANFLRPYLYDEAEKALYIHPALLITLLTGLSKEQKVFVMYLVRTTGTAKQLAPFVRMGDGRMPEFSGPLHAWIDGYDCAKLQEEVKKTRDDEIERDARIAGLSSATLTA